MLRHLSIKDFAVVRATELEFGPGMTVVSGETGAGKSLMVDALGFLSGLRADSGVVRHGAARAELSAEFAPEPDAAARRWLRENELDDEDQCQLRRIIRADGGSRAWINGRPVTLTQLTELAATLVEIHGQHEQQALLARPSQLALLDAFARNEAERGQVRQAAARWQALVDEAESLSRQGDVSDRIGYLEHQLGELQREDLEPASIEQLGSSHRRQAHASALIAACDVAVARLNGDDDTSALQLLQQTRHELSRVAEHDPRLGEVDALLDSAVIQLHEALVLLDRVLGDLDADPEQFEDIERRLGRLHDLSRKHRVPMESLGEHRDAMQAEVEQLRGADVRLQALAGEIERAAGQWQVVADVLSSSRRKAAKALSDTTTTLIGELGMGGGQFLIEIEPQAVSKPDPNGAERVEFLVAANAGQPPRALRKVASGGELSRISLAIEVAALDLDAVPTMVFDEVDSGIGGAVADIVGHKLRALGEKRQVLCVTHLPQVASKGHAHYRVSKAPVDGMTQSAVEKLDTKAREEELARMLGGVEVSKEARAAARKLLQV
ncbi:DNA repair protein RecN [Stenotrophomonas rhizophila]|jgi:DNA repair protein RecN (Recombination protein N)|uniref:DNA repair protein RecN n=1 Tax=Stenotrophomonas nematodicola TaxID=2656746 RepID=A0ABW7D2A7_9GAMM|nr:DNA repair protein RecN [Stenotrophomonas sp. BIGb0135]MCS4235942.1 DNA repair protein RecN (Recombination protein N) [Stenotrophomonas sp. BIGb0135]